jgi:hypothetical protein
MAIVTSRQTLIDHCLRRLGYPVTEINVDIDQVEDRIDDTLQLYQEFHSDATVRNYLKHQVTATDVSNKYITLDPSILFLTRLFPISNVFNTGYNMFDIKYQMMLNDMGDMHRWSGDMAYYEQLQQYLSLLDMKLNGQPIVTFSRRENRLYIWGEWQNNDIREGDYVIAEVYQIVDPQQNTSIYNDMFVKDYATAALKYQWGNNMGKFEGVQLPGGVTINGAQLKEEGKSEMEELRERMRSEHEMPIDFIVG